MLEECDDDSDVEEAGARLNTREEELSEQYGTEEVEAEKNNEEGNLGAKQRCSSLSSNLHTTAEYAEENFESDSEVSSEGSGESDSAHSDSGSGSDSANTSVAHSLDSDVENQSENSAQSVEYVCRGSNMTAKEALLDQLKLFVDQRWTKTSLDKNIKFIKRLLPDPNSFPSSGKNALKQLESLTSSCSEVGYSYCNECLLLSGACNHTAGESKFYSFPIGEQIKHMFEQRGLASAVEFYHNHHSKKDGFICDITDGTEYLKIRVKLSNKFDLVLLWNTDGVSLSNSSKLELWPILCTICEVPPRLRASFIILAGVYVGYKKPNMNVFLKPFCDSLQNLWEEGVSWVHPVSKETIISKIAAPVLSADAPAKALVLVTKNHNSRFGCNTCEQKTKKIPLTAEEVEFNLNVTDNRKKKKRKRRFLFEDDTAAAELRNGERMDKLGELAELRGKSRRGVIGKAIISEIPLLDRAVCICAEYLHLVLLGTVKYLLDLIFFTQGPWYLGDRLSTINELINNIKVPDYVKRLPSDVDKFRFWKGSDFRAFLLYYSLPIFKNLLPDKYYQHWFLLVASSYIFLKDAIAENEIDLGEIMLRSFVRDIGQLYGERCYTYNCHTMLHIPLLVRRWGPLWATSAFVFESFNGFIGDHIHGTKHIGKELIENIKISQSVAVLDNIVNSPSLNFLQFPRHAGNNALLGKAFSQNCLEVAEQTALRSCSDLGCYVLHNRATLSNVTYTSKYYDVDKKRGNSFIQFHESEHMYGQIIVFLKAEDTSLHCLVNKFKVKPVNILYHEESRYILKNFVPVSNTAELCVISVENISMKVLQVGTYLVIRPNTIEVNL